MVLVVNLKGPCRMAKDFPATVHMETDIDPNEELGHDSDDFDSSSSSGEEDLGPEDGENEQEDEEADLDSYGAL